MAKGIIFFDSQKIYTKFLIIFFQDLFFQIPLIVNIYFCIKAFFALFNCEKQC